MTAESPHAEQPRRRERDRNTNARCHRAHLQLGALNRGKSIAMACACAGCMSASLCRQRARSIPHRAADSFAAPPTAACTAAVASCRRHMGSERRGRRGDGRSRRRSTRSSHRFDTRASTSPTVVMTHHRSSGPAGFPGLSGAEGNRPGPPTRWPLQGMKLSHPVRANAGACASPSRNASISAARAAASASPSSMSLPM